MNSDYLRREGENDLDYGMRLISIKKDLRPGDLDWCDIVELLGLDYNPDSLRKSQDSPFGGLSVYREMKRRIASGATQDEQKSLNVGLQELQKMKFAISEERAALNRALREQQRIESVKELALKCVGKMKPLDTNNLSANFYKREFGSKAMILQLSDFHYGLNINEYNNQYNIDIFHERMSLLLRSVLDTLVEEEEVRELVILGLGDFISGLIHNIIRIESRENVVQQVIAVSEALIDFIYTISAYLPVRYYDCVGNHSRLFEDKENALSKESFDVLIHYILEMRFKDVSEVQIMGYTINEKIGSFDVCNKKYGFCHGHDFNIGTLAKDFSAMTKEFYEAIFIGHIHHLFIEEQNETLVIANGTFAGNDEYANNLRKSSLPSQNLIIVGAGGIEAIKPIKLEGMINSGTVM